MTFAQNTNGKIIGNVSDPSGAVIPGATITVEETATHVITKAVTGKGGNFEVLSLPIGKYTVEVAANGFATTKSPEYRIEINQTQKVDFKLPLAGTTQAIDVTIQAAPIDTVSSTVGGSVTDRPLVDLPLNGRNILDLAQLQPGVTTGNNPGNTGAGSVSIAGGRTDSVTFLLDGGNNANLLNNGVVFTPNPDAVQEFRILENTYSAEYGRNGGGVISVATKSGTHDYHGSLFEFARNTAFNANSFFNKRNNIPRDDLKRHQFGGTFGGEFFVPKILPRKDRFFYFVSYQGQRLTQAVNLGAQQVATTAEVVNGDFSGAGAATQGAVAAFLHANPYFQPNATLAAQGIFNPATFDPVAQKYISSGIFAYSPSGFVNPVASSVNNYDQYNGKFDFQLSEKDHLTISLAQNRNPSTQPFGGPVGLNTSTTAFPVSDETDAYIANIDETHAFTAKLLNDVRFVAQRSKNAQAVPLETLPTPAQLGIGVTPDVSTGPTTLSFVDTGAAYGFSYQGPTTLVNNTFAYTDDLSWVHGRHTLKFGVYFSPYQNNTLYDFYVDGNFSYNGLTDPNSGQIGVGSGFAEFLAGAPDNYLQFGSAPSNIRSKATAAYAQDQWQVLPNLTLNYGLRYEFSTPKSDTKGRSFSLIPGHQSQRFTGAPEGLLFPGDPGAPTGSNFAVKDNLAPRLGFAYDIGGKGRTVVRGGGGMFFDILKGEDNLQFNGQAPFFGFEFLQFNQPTGATGPLNEYENPFAATGTTNTFPSKPPTQNLDFGAAGFLPFGGGGVYFVDPHLRTPYTIQYNLGVQQDLGTGVILEVAYVGTVSRKYTALADSNPFVLGSSTERLYSQANGGAPYSFLDTFRNITSGSYNSLQASLRKQSSHIHNFGTTYFQFSYTWAKNMDNVSGFRQRTAEVPYYNPGQFYGPSDTNVPQRVVFSGGWDLPFQDLFPRAPEAVSKGWSLYPIASYQSGFPLDVLAGFQRNGQPGPTGAGDQELIRANLVGTHVARFNPYQTTNPDGGAVYLSPSNFTTANITGYGTLRRNSFYGPGYGNVDMSVVKDTYIVQGAHPVSFELRADMFNMFNHTQFQAPNTTISSAQFGEITTTFAPRIIQFAGKIRF